MSVFEGRAWISNQGLVDVSIEVEEGYISSVKKTNLNPNIVPVVFIVGK